MSDVSGWGGRRAQQLRLLVLDTYGDTCHLCGGYGADTADHLVPRSVAPELAWSLDNLRPAHQRCNSSRGAMPLGEWFAAHPMTTRANAEASRRW